MKIYEVQAVRIDTGEILSSCPAVVRDGLSPDARFYNHVKLHIGLSQFVLFDTDERLDTFLQIVSNMQNTAHYEKYLIYSNKQLKLDL